MSSGTSHEEKARAPAPHDLRRNVRGTARAGCADVMKLPTSFVAALSLVCLVPLAGCAAPADADAEQGDSTADAITKKDLNKYGMAVGILSTGAEAKKLFKAIKDSGAVESDRHVVTAGLTALELGLAKAGDDDADEAFGVTCQAAEGDSTFHADTCSINAVIDMAQQPESGVVLTGKLARAVAEKLPRTSPAGLVGSASYGAGTISCKVIPGPAGSRCTVEGMIVTETFDKMIDGEDSPMSTAEAKKVITAFFPGA